MEKTSYVYILSNWRGNVLYVGVSNNLKRRVFEHKNKISGGFTAQYNVNRLVWYEVYEDISAAISREKQIKGGPRRRKLLLISKFNPNWIDLYDRL